MQPSSLAGYVDSDARVDRLRRANRLRAVQSELNVELAEQRRESDVERRRRAATREQAMAEALHAEQTSEERRAKMVRLVRAEAPELRELEAKLLAAYTAKQRAAQIDEQKGRKVREEAVLLEERQATEAHLARLAAADQERQGERRARLESEAEEAQAAIHAKTLSSAEAAEHHRRERREVDAIVARLAEEDYLQQLSRTETQRALRAQHELFMTQLDERKTAELGVLRAEEAAIARYTDDVTSRRAGDARLRAEREAQKAKLLAHQTETIEAERRRKVELEGLVEDLYAEQASMKARDAAAAEARKKVAERAAMIRANETQLEHKATLKKQRLAEEQAFRQKMMEKFAADDRVDQMTALKKKQMKADHAAKVLEFIEAKREQQAEDDQLEGQLAEQRRAREAEWAEIVRDERKRLLREHAANLVGRLPAGAVTNAEEREVVMDALRGEANRVAELGATRGKF